MPSVCDLLGSPHRALSPTQLWLPADKLRNNRDAAEYKPVVLGLIFLKHISDAFEELHEKLITGKGDYKGADPERCRRVRRRKRVLGSH